MGMNASTIRVLSGLLRERETRGDAITFGVQRIGADYPALQRIFRETNFPAQSLEPSEIVPDPSAKSGERVHQDTFFRMLGYSKVEGIDYYPDERPTHQLDLNEPVPEELRGSYDLVCDCGTTEHCFNVPQVLTNALELLRPNGLVVHVTPVTGWLTHGFYQFCPSLYFHFYAENGFENLEARISYAGRVLNPAEYLPATDLLGRKALLIFVARKPAESGPVRWPIQGAYATPEIERVVETYGGLRSETGRSGRRSIWSPNAWKSDVGAFLKQYLRLARRGRAL